MKIAFNEIKAEIVSLAQAYHEGDESTREGLRAIADFFPMAKTEEDGEHRATIIRAYGEIFLVEDTRGGETGVVSYLLPLM